MSTNLLTYGTLTPAYNRDYKSKKALLEDFNSGKDFYLNGPADFGYCSIRDFAKGAQVTFRYGQLMKVAIYTIK
jgi:hypothetical protein